ncbi:hypothetical protein Sfulv_06890 [Streptomyces fulvorobeus]|uniref:HTH merR-type domain-containing protein n=1 Tax=Streptomyces fulvorobeus TaxID=284028 RepID=A0A7J0C0E6_9ACTN|nr:hypothetical protein Sfulv_06890 [Streptomyces fulvorobeus]
MREAVVAGGSIGPGGLRGGAAHRRPHREQPYPNVRVETGGVARARPARTRRARTTRVDGKHMQIGEVAARTELSLRTIRHYEESGLVAPSARSQGGFRLYTETDVARLMVIRRMKPLGFTLDQMRELLDATDRLDSGRDLPADERGALMGRLRAYEQAATEQVDRLRVQLARAEDFAATLRARLDPGVPAASTGTP